MNNVILYPQLHDYEWMRTRLKLPGKVVAADLIALKAGEIPLLVQCKTDAKLFRGIELDALTELAKQSGALVVLASRGKRRGAIAWIPRWVARDHSAGRLHSVCEGGC